MLIFDLFYLLAIAALTPWLVWRSISTGRYRSGLAAKIFGRVVVPNPENKPVAWFHAVSVGEVNLLCTLIPAFRKRHPDWLVVVSATTDTGLAEAHKQFVNLVVISWPFDFSWAVSTAIDAVKPSLIVLTESELWPNFLHIARARRVPVIVVNARISPRSFARLKRIAGPARRILFNNIARFAVQEKEYKDRLHQLGVSSEKLVVTGSVKYDGAFKERNSQKMAMLSTLLTLGKNEFPNRVIWLAGSTHSPEESIVLRIFLQLRQRFPQLRLILVPRHPDRFEEVARLIEHSGLPFARRSRIVEPLPEMPAVVLLDTVGELGVAWGVADVGFTGGSLDGKRGGQSMIEPAGYGVPCVFGPHVWNFKDAAKRLVEVGGAVMVLDTQALEIELANLIADADLRNRMGIAARELVRRQQGAATRTLEAMDALLPSDELSKAA